VSLNCAAEKREIIGLVERSSLSVRRTLDRLGILKSTFYGWYERYREGSDAALEEKPSRLVVTPGALSDCPTEGKRNETR
jgi:transposase-like protein